MIHFSDAAEMPQGPDEPLLAPGRNCPLHYRYAPSSLCRAPELGAETLYVIGGLYGNLPALDALERLAAQEAAVSGRAPILVFNGDFNWFNTSPVYYERINRRVLAHRATAGNVELEIADPGEDAGCGCAYPRWVDDAVVARSNAILERLRTAAAGHPQVRRALAALPMNMVAQVGNARIAIVHGDARALAGWGFSREALATTSGRRRAADWLARAGAHVFACTHTCEPACARIGDGDASGVVINNGAAGMPNFRDGLFGVITRIATTPCPVPARLYGTRVAGVHVDALALHYDAHAWWRDFREQWAPGSAGDLGYGERIRRGTRLALTQVVAGI